MAVSLLEIETVSSKVCAPNRVGVSLIKLSLTTIKGMLTGTIGELN